MNYLVKVYYERLLADNQSELEKLYNEVARREQLAEEIEAEYSEFIEEDEDMNADDTEHARAYESDIRRGL